MPASPASASLAALIQAYETLTPDAIPALLALYDDAAEFKDPFNDVRGRDAIGGIFMQMFQKLSEPRFVVRERMTAADQGFLVWDMHFALKRAPDRELVIRGATHLRFSETGLVRLHRDYWDPVEELYAKLPLIGALIGWFRR